MRTAALTCLLVALTAGSAAAQQAQLRVDRQAYSGLPFTVTVIAEGFDEDPTPEQPELVIPDAEVRAVGVQPNVSSGMRIVNGRRTQWRRVTWVFRYRVEAKTAGTYEIPPVTITQGTKKATAQGGRVSVRDIPATDDMAIELTLPDRPVWVGETVPVHVDWFLRKEVGDHLFSVPLFERDSQFRVAAPPNVGRDSLSFPTADSTIDLPLEQSEVNRANGKFLRARSTALVTPVEAGTFELEPARVVAKLKVGVGRDRLGFPTARTSLFSARDVPRTLTVRPLPMSGRPPSFSGAVGQSFSIAVEASRSVVKLGEPVTLTVTVRGDTRLDGLSLPDLTAAGLDEEAFTVPEEPPVGRLTADDGREKEFEVTVQVKSPNVDTIPAIPFSFFDPEEGEYRTVRSEAIALNVAGAAIVGAGDVVSSQRDASGGGGAVSVRGADLGLSPPGETMREALSLGAIAPLLWALYLVPLAILIGCVVWARRRAHKDDRSELDDAARVLRDAVDRARRDPARDAVGPLVGAVRGYARAAGRGGDAADLVARLETAGFAPDAAGEPLPSALVDEAAELPAAWTEPKPARRAPTGAAIILLALSAAGVARADAADPLAEARAAYGQAMASSDREIKTAKFAAAAQLFASVADDQRGHPELLTDRGNAALGAGDLGTAILAYRRALLLDPGLDRARTNLAWARDQLPKWVPKADSAGAVDTLFFWHTRMTLAERHLVAALAFGLTCLLLAPWSRKHNRLLRRVAILPAAIWIAMLASALLEPDRSADAVVVSDGVVLRAADSAGAPSALANPLPGGVEVAITDRRDGWIRVSLADGTTGWLPSDAARRVSAERR